MLAPRTTSRLFTAALSFATIAACRTTPDEPSAPAATTTTPAVIPVPTHNDIQLASAKSTPGDPLAGKWTMADATKDLAGTGSIVATIDTNHGKIACKLYDDKAPITVANFIGLATGKRTWKNPAGQWVNTPAYDGTTFHRIIKDFMIQGGDAAGTGAGEPGYTFVDEIWPGGKHDRAGLLCMANRGPNTNGAQFFITESAGPSVTGLDMHHSYTIFGECSPVETIHEIASVPTGPRDKPITPVTINKVTIARDKK